MKKKLSFIGVMMLVFMVSMVNVFAEPVQSIKLVSAKRQEGYVAGTYWPKKILSDGNYAYCLNHRLSVPYNHTLKYIGDLDAGYSYIILNGYPNKSITGNADYDYYITQGAIHWYIDRVNGVADSKKGNLNASFKTNGSDPKNLRPKMKTLVEEALKVRSQGYIAPAANLSTDSKTMKLSSDRSYFISSAIKITTTSGMLSKVKTIDVKVSGPSGTTLVDGNGKTKTSFASGDVFYVKVPTSSLTTLNANVKVTMSGSGEIYKASKYKSTSANNVQDLTVAKINTYPNTFSESLDFNLTTTKVEISKVDITSEKELPGATLELKDAKGNIIEKWVSTEEKHIINHLPAGNYVLTETIAPDGYVRATDVKFTVKADGTVTSVVMVDDYTKVEISKQDVTNKKELSGAKLKLYDEEGKVIAEWTSSDKPYYMEKLKVGKYKLVEEIAPEGYVLAKEAVEFEVLETGDIQKVVMFNTPLTPTPDTAFHPSTMLYIVATLLGCFGIGLVYWNAKKRS